LALSSVYAADMERKPDVIELRLVVTAPDYGEALRFYRDVLGLTEQAAFSSPGGRVTILVAVTQLTSASTRRPAAHSLF
jgi:predicted enzyme related to lactoylglutathione lyase